MHLTLSTLPPEVGHLTHHTTLQMMEWSVNMAASWTCPTKWKLELEWGRNISLFAGD
jgi:hypothetical protein